MKARIKSTGDVVEVEKHKLRFADNTTKIYYRDIFDGDRYEESEIVEMTDDVALTPTDWQAYRMEVAKECMAAMFASEIYIDGNTADTAKEAIKAADALINELQKTAQK